MHKRTIWVTIVFLPRILLAKPTRLANSLLIFCPILTNLLTLTLRLLNFWKRLRLSLKMKMNPRNTIFRLKLLCLSRTFEFQKAKMFSLSVKLMDIQSQKYSEFSLGVKNIDDIENFNNIINITLNNSDAKIIV